MAADRHETDSGHELRLEGIGLLLGGGFLLALIVGSFFLGRWVERRSGAPEALLAEPSGPLAQVGELEPDAEAADGLTYFDTVEGGEMAVEPEREVRPAAAPPAEAARGLPSAADPAARVEAQPEAGRFYVQIMALHDQEGAATVIETLRRQGHEVRLFSERDGQGTLYKVRVGGYATRGEADAARDELKRAGHPGAFVWPAE